MKQNDNKKANVLHFLSNLEKNIIIKVFKPIFHSIYSDGAIWTKIMQSDQRLAIMMKLEKKV